MDGVEVRVAGGLQQLLSVNATHIHTYLVHEGQLHVHEKRKCVDGMVSEDDGVGMLWHLGSLGKSHSQTPMGFDLDAVPEHPSLMHDWCFIALCVIPHHVYFHFVDGEL